MANTSGFYKYFSATQEILYAPNRVHTPNGSVTKETKGEIDGWKWFDSEYEAYFFHNMTPANPELSDEISRMQARIALKRAGKLRLVETLVAGADEEVQLVWKDAQVFKRSSPMLNSLAGALGMTEADIDDLFAVARTIEV